MPAQPFTIAIPDGVIDDLHQRLDRTRWVTDLPGAGWEYGTNATWLRDLLDYWRHGYDWRAQEAALNALPHFRTEIEGLGIHCIHVRSPRPDAVPILLTHGWPDSFLRMLKLIPRLTDPARHGLRSDIAFHVVVPSIPGHGFSDPARERGFSQADVARLWHALMGELGYSRYLTHGGDTGSGIHHHLAQAHPEAVLGQHLTNVPHTTTLPLADTFDDLSEEERDFLTRAEAWGRAEGAYGHLHETKPQSLAIGLNDSPAGLASWIVEKFRTWSDCDGNVLSRFTRDELLTNVTLYWVTQTIGTSFLMYYEPPPRDLLMTYRQRVEVPTAFALFPKDLVRESRAWAERFFTITRWTEMPRGGHFAAMEEPDLLAEDIVAFAQSVQEPSGRIGS